MEARRATVFAVGAALAVVAGCGGQKQQDEDEPSGRYEVEVVEATFPERQKLAKRSNLVIRVRNAGSKVVPNITVTVNGFARRVDDDDLADPSRPVFVINGRQKRIGDYPEAKEQSPVGCETAYVGTWGCGKLKPGQEKTFRWGVTAVQAGSFKIKWTVAAGLDGKAKAVLAGGERPSGSFSVSVSREPDQSRVDPDTGDVVNAD